MEHNFTSKNTSDKIALIAELEHIRRHACRSMLSHDIPEDDKVFYAVIAERAKSIRREYMSKNFPKCPDALWCLGKASASLRQIAYESFEGDDEMLAKIDELVDNVWEKITGEDLSDCSACKDDKKDGTDSPSD